jgi:putative ABC transport system substrate-binding protein
MTTRREVLTLLGAAGAAAWPVAAQSQPSMPVVGLLRSTLAQAFAGIVKALKEGLAEAGFIEGSNVLIEQRWAEANQNYCRKWQPT